MNRGMLLTRNEVLGLPDSTLHRYPLDGYRGLLPRYTVTMDFMVIQTTEYTDFTVCRSRSRVPQVKRILEGKDLQTDICPSKSGYYSSANCNCVLQNSYIPLYFIHLEKCTLVIMYK